MTVPSWQFVLFAIAGAAFFNLSAAPRWRGAVWLVLNISFLATFARGPISLLPIVGFLAFGFAGIVAGRARRRWVTPVFIVLTFAAFVWLKRYAFVPVAAWLPMAYTTVGLSYVFFRVMHLVIDAGAGYPQRIRLLSFLNYALNFTSLVSGPIQRYEDYQRMAEREWLPLSEMEVGWALWRMILGAFKVMIVSVALHAAQRDEIAALAPSQPFDLRVMEAALIVIIYPLYLYANFSGYTDFVIGAARLFRLRLPENFDRPFSSENFITFWNRWHITLSAWLKSYVFSPLLLHLMRRVRSRYAHQYLGVIALLVTFFLVGAWHGQTAAFLFFGLLQGGGVAGNRLYQLRMTEWLGPAIYRRLCTNPLYRSLSRGFTFAWFAFTLLWFWSSWGELAHFVDAIGAGGTALMWLAIVLASTLTLAALEVAREIMFSFRLGGRPFVASRYARTAFATAMCLALGVSVAVLHLSSPEIVYKGF